MLRPMSDQDPERARRLASMAKINRHFARLVPHNQALGLDVVDLDEGTAHLRLPYAAELVGNVDTGVLHGGAITALMDAACGAAVFMKLPSPVPIATLDLRIDYLKPGAAGRDIDARCECYRLTRNVAFVRGIAFHDDPDDPIAAAAGTFMVSTRAQGAGERSA
jgi:uncharacterized protein (TIGR00369 family)